jgi:hypothetical protein
MKNQIQTLRYEAPEEFHARKAVQQIQKWIEKNYPRLAASAKTKMIIECLIELTEERKVLATKG